MPKITQSILQQRIRFVGHSFHSKEELARDVLLGSQNMGNNQLVAQRRLYINQLISDTGCSYQELPAVM